MSDPTDVEGDDEVADRLRAIVSMAGSIRWFEGPGPDPRAVDDIVRDFARRLGPDGPAFRRVDWLRGGLGLLHPGGTVDPHLPWGRRWAGSREYLGRAAAAIQSRVASDPVARRRVGPPLWPVPGMINVSGEPIVALESSLSPLGPLAEGSRDRAVAWGLLCEAESRFRDALAGELLADADPAPNPFLQLVELYRSGCFPMGWEGDVFTVFVHEGG